MRNNAWIALAVMLLMSAAACHKKDDKAEQLKALDKALQAGVFSKEEYDAKKQALLGTPAAAPAPPAAATPAPAATPQGFDPSAVAPPSDGGVSTTPPATPPSNAPPAQAQLPPAVQTPPQPPAPAPKRAQPAARVPASSPPQVPPASQPPQPYAPAVPSSPPAVPSSPPEVPPQPPPQTRAANRGDDADPAPLAGCNDSEFRSGGAEVQERFFPVSVDAVHRAASLAFQNLDFTIHKDSKNEMEASKRKHLSAVVGAGGEKLVLHFESAQKGGQAGTRVTGETKKSIVGRLSQKSWTSAVLAQIGCNLRSGK